MNGSKASDIFSIHQQQNLNGGSTATAANESVTSDSQRNANGGGVHFQKLIGLHKFVVNKTSGKQMSNTAAMTQAT